MTRKIKVLHLAAECKPFAQVGGLGDVVGALPPALAKLGLDISVLIPKYDVINSRRYHLRLVAKKLQVNIGSDRQFFDLYQTKLQNSAVNYYFLDHPLFHKGQVYISKTRNKKLIDLERFAFFSKAAVEVIKHFWPRPDVVHTHDWHTALVPSFLDQAANHYAGFHQIRTLFTIHNLGNQGQTGRDFVDYLQINPAEEPAIFEDYNDDDYLNLMKIGILSADLITTVSPTYAKEILTPRYGFKLQDYLDRRRQDLTGIINGLDVKLFDPATDQSLVKNYSSQNWRSNKKLNKYALQKRLGWPTSDRPLFGLVSRLVQQKGLDILLPSLKKLIKKDWQLVVLGSGQPKYEKALESLAKRYPAKVSVSLKFDLKLADQIYAASDFFLMPSQFEPCGLGQLIAMRYGSLPIVRATGGLKDTVSHNQTGLVFNDYSAAALTRALGQALVLYQSKKWYTMVKNAMRQDFSWSESAKKYQQLYQKLA